MMLLAGTTAPAAAATTAAARRWTGAAGAAAGRMARIQQRIAHPGSRGITLVGGGSGLRAGGVVMRASPPEQQQQDAPSSSGSGGEEEPVWVRRERERALQAEAGKGELPWPLYLVFSALVAIASVGSVFEYLDGNAIFGVVPPSSPLWAPILGFFALTGVPTAGFLFFKGVQAANAAAERQDRLDGYIK